MALDALQRDTKRAYRILSGPPGMVDDLVAALEQHYSPMSFTINAVVDQIVVTVVLINKSIVREQALMQARQQTFGVPGRPI